MRGAIIENGTNYAENWSLHFTLPQALRATEFLLVVFRAGTTGTERVTQHRGRSEACTSHVKLRE